MGGSAICSPAPLVALLRQFRPRVHQVQPIASERAASVADIGRRDTVAVFDFRRYERDTFEFAKEAKGSRARIVLFTDPWLSPVADLADAVLPAHVVGPAPFESLTPTLALVETLVSAVAQGLGDAGDQRFSHFGGIADHWVRPWPSYDDLDATEDSDQPSERGTSASPDRPDLRRGDLVFHPYRSRNKALTPHRRRPVRSTLGLLVVGATAAATTLAPLDTALAKKDSAVRHVAYQQWGSASEFGAGTFAGTEASPAAHCG